MKKTVALLLTLAMVLALCACGGGSTTSQQEPKEQKDNTVVEPTVEATAEPSSKNVITLGETISIDNVEFTFSSVEITDKIETEVQSNTTQRDESVGLSHSSSSSTSSSKASMLASEGTKFIALNGIVRNMGTSDIELGNIVGEIIVDNAIVENAFIQVAQGGAFDSLLTPDSIGQIYIFVIVEEAEANNSNNIEIRVGCNDGFSAPPSAINKCDNIYTYTGGLTH